MPKSRSSRKSKSSSHDLGLSPFSSGFGSKSGDDERSKWSTFKRRLPTTPTTPTFAHGVKHSSTPKKKKGSPRKSLDLSSTGEIVAKPHSFHCGIEKAELSATRNNLSKEWGSSCGGHMNIAIVGDSFVQNMGEHIEKRNKLNFGLDENLFKIRLATKSTAKIKDLEELFQSFKEPQHLLIIDLGLYDLGTRDTCATKLADELFKELLQIIKKYGVIHVIVLHATPHLMAGRDIEPRHNYNNRCCEFNLRLQHLAFNHNDFSSVEHKKISIYNDTYLCDDGIHLNEKGNDVYIETIQKCVYQIGIPKLTADEDDESGGPMADASSIEDSSYDVVMEY